jgi:hypothetical protein
MGWGLFNADPGSLDAWWRYGTALRTGSAQRAVDAWDSELAAVATVLDRWRETFCKALEGAVAPVRGSDLGPKVGRLLAEAGRPLSAVDGRLAATARVHDLTVVTRNAADFALPGVNVRNPLKIGERR